MSCPASQAVPDKVSTFDALVSLSPEAIVLTR